MAPSPFIQKKRNGKTAFIVVSLFAGISAVTAVAGVYRAFIRNPVPFATTELTAMSPNLFTPPVVPSSDKREKADVPPASAEQPETAAADISPTTEPLPETAPTAVPVSAPEDKTGASPKDPLSEVVAILAEDPAVDALQKAQDADLEKKIREIERLDAERLKQNDGVLPPEPEKKPSQTPEMPVENPTVPDAPPAAAPTPVPELPSAPVSLKGEDLVEHLLGPSGQLRFAKTEDELPQPDLIQGSFMSSLPNFALIKPKSGAAGVPLHLIDPLPEMQEKSKYGPLPKKDSAGNSPLKAYAAPAVPPQTPYMSFLLTGLGRRRNVTKAAIGVMPSFVSLSFSPYSSDFEADIRDARQTGHETLIDLPMQHGVFPESDPGPLGLVAGFSEQENRARLYKVMARPVAYIGLTAQHNQNFSYYESAQMKAFVAELDRRGLALIAGTDDKNMPVYRETLRPDVYIADNMYRSAIRARLEKAKALAKEKGGVLVRVDALPVSLIAILEFVNPLLPKDETTVPEISFVPLSYHIEKTLEKKK